MASSRRGPEELMARVRAERTAGSGREVGADRDVRMLGLALVVGFVALVVLRIVVGDDLRARVDEQACAVTGCTGTGMAVTGWALVALPAVWAAVTVGLWSRLSAVARVAALLVAFALALLGWVHVPGKRSSLAFLLAGPGAGAMATGIRWAGIGVAVAVVAATVAAVRSAAPRAAGRPAPSVGVIVAVVLLGSVTVAVARAEPTPVTVATAMPERTFRAAGDTLTRTGGRDLRGCAGVLADDDLLAGCVRTVRVSYTTDDSDAVVHLAAVLFPGERQARDRRGVLRRGTGQRGVPGEAVALSSTTGSWVLLTSVAHADGRPIAEPDRGHLLWAAKQVAYRFIGRQVGLLVAPSPADGIGPRTP